MAMPKQLNGYHNCISLLMIESKSIIRYRSAMENDLPPNDNLYYFSRKKKDTCILDLCGKIMGSRAGMLSEVLLQLKDAGVSKVILNFLNVTAIDSLGVKAIIAALEAGLSVKIIYISTLCKQILEQDRTAKTIPIYGSEAEAMGSLANPDKGFKEMRTHNRITTNIPVEILINHTRQRGVLLNISEGGALIGYLDPITPEPYTIKQMNITMELPLLGSIALEGKPVRFGRTSEMNIMAIALPSTEKNQTSVKQVYKDTSLSSDQFSYLPNSNGG